MKIYVGNLANAVTEQDLQGLFATYGQVKTTSIIKDRFSGQSRGFGFVEMFEQEEAQKAIDALNGYELQGSRLRVSEARPKQDRPAGGMGRGGFGGPRSGGPRGGGFGGPRGGDRRY